MRGAPLAAVLAAALLLPSAAAPPTASPYAHAPIRYHLDATNLTLATWWYKVKVQQAFTYWAEGGAGELGWTPTFAATDDASSADVNVWFLDARRVDETCANETRAFACARLDSERPTWSVEIKTRREGDGQHYSFDLVGDVAKHEIGHTLGLPHSPDPRSIMFASRDATAYGDAQPIDDWRPVAFGIGGLLLVLVVAALVIVRAGRSREDEEPPREP